MKKALPLFLLSWLLIVFSCKQDDFEPENHEHGKTENKQISFREFLNQQGNKPEVQKIKKYFTGTATGISAKNGDSLNWEIDTTGITQITTPELTTYTFRVIENDTISGFRNVIVRDYNNEIKTYLVHYPDGVDFEHHTEPTVIVEELEEGLMKAMPQCYGLRWQCQQCGMTMCTVEPGWVLIGQPCSDNGGGQGGGGYPGDPYADPGWPTNPGDSPWNGGGAGGSGGASETPCSALNRKSLDQTFIAKINELKAKLNTNTPYEHGYVNHNPKENADITSNQTNQYSTTASVMEEDCKSKADIQIEGAHTFGYMHTHPTKNRCPQSMGVFSSADIRHFVRMVKLRYDADLSTNDVYGIIVGDHGVYALKMESLNNFGNNYNFMSGAEAKKFWADFERRYENIVPEEEENNNRQNNERAVLEMLIPNFNIIGVAIYRANDNLTEWSKLPLDESGNPVGTPCN